MAQNLDWARARAILAAPAAMTFKELKAVVAAMGGKMKSRAEGESFLANNADLSALTPSQKEEVMVALGIHQPPAPTVPDPAAQPEEPPAEEEDAEVEEEEAPAPARRRMPLWAWLVIAFVVLAMIFTALGIAGFNVLRNAMNERAGIVATPTAMVVVATPAPTQKVVEPPAVVPTAIVATEASVVVEPVIVQADSVFHFAGAAPAYNDFRTAVRMPGDKAVFVWSFDTALDGAVIKRIWPDDILISAILYIPGEEPLDITGLFGMFTVPAGGTGDPSLDAVLAERGVNIVDGEILQQNKNAVLLGNVPAGSKIVFEIKDNEELAVNRGIGVVIDQTVDAFTVPVK